MRHSPDVVFINGRFLTQPFTGVQRFAKEIVLAIDRLLAECNEASQQFRLLMPRPAGWEMNLRRIVAQRVGLLNGHLWEQLVLPKAARGGPLLSLGNSGPVGHRAQFLTIHDAGVFANPRNFTRSFRIWYRWLHRRLGRSPARLFTVSEFSKRELIRYCGLPAERIEVVYNGCDHMERCSAAEDLLRVHCIVPGRYVLCVGWKSPNKNFGLVVEAVRRIGAPELDIVAVGASNRGVFRQTEKIDGVRIRDLGHVSDAASRRAGPAGSCRAPRARRTPSP